MTPKLLTVPQVALALQLRYGAARDLIYRRALGDVTVVNGKVRVSAAAVARYQKGRKS